MEAEALFPKLVPRRNASRKAVAGHQRARLHAAMIEACARHGYAATTARELVGLAGVSTKALYAHFGSKEECFYATYDVVVQHAMGRISAAYRGEPGAEAGDWDDGLCRAFDAFAAELVDRPGPSRLALIEVLAATPVACERIERAEALFARMIAASLAQAPDGGAIPPAIVRGLVGGIWFVARARFSEGRPEAIAAGGAELKDWLLAYRTAAGARLPVGRGRQAGAPGGPRGAEREETVRMRLLEATATIIARGGYEALSPAHVADEAGVAEVAFRAEFEDTRACFLVALEWLSADALAAAVREGEAASSWAAGVCRAVDALFRRLAWDGALARAAFLDAFAARPAGAARLNAILRGFADTLVRRAPAGRRPSPLVAEAIVGSVWSVAHRHVVQGRRELLPAAASRAAFLTLAPIVGADAAVAAIGAEAEAG
ncbi:MAG: TetR/AcrR family transcriptional regulator [Actinobacteria bacterium]|nr:TetR/AcrR family transcriptional regulator [Actinomycetota bacterium]